MVRLIVAADVRTVIGQSVFKIGTGETDEHRAVVKAAPIIVSLKERIAQARTTLKKARAEALAEAYRVQQASDPAAAQPFVLTDVIGFVLKQQGHSWAEYGRHVRWADYDAYAGLRALANGEAVAAVIDAITTTPFLHYMEDWKQHAGLTVC